MKLKRLFTVALVSSALGLMAAEPLKLNTTAPVKPGFGSAGLFEKNSQERGFLKLKKSVFSASGKEWDENEVSGSGLFIHLGLFSPPETYMDPDALDITTQPFGTNLRYGLGVDFEVGSFFRLIKLREGLIGLGLRATWLSVSYTSLTDGPDIWRVAQISPLRVGPQFSFALNETMGLDAFYQLGYNLTAKFGEIDDPANTKDVGANGTYMGVSHELGAAFHYKVFCLGLGYRMGQMSNESNVYDGKELADDELDKKTSSINNFHVTLGFRF